MEYDNPLKGHGKTKVSVPKSIGNGSCLGRRKSFAKAKMSKGEKKLMSPQQLEIRTEKDLKKYNGYLKKKVRDKQKLAAHRESFKYVE